MCIMTAFLQHEVSINFEKKISVANLPIETYIEGSNRAVCYEIFKRLNMAGIIYDNTVLLPFRVSPPPKENYPPALIYKFDLNGDSQDIEMDQIAAAVPIKKENPVTGKIELINGTVIQLKRKGVYINPLDQHCFEELTIIEVDCDGEKRKTVCSLGFIDVCFY